jgi:hypothetical protein
VKVESFDKGACVYISDDDPNNLFAVPKFDPINQTTMTSISSGTGK